MKRYDLIVVGSGAGLLVLEAALQAGLRCAIVEQAKFGGTCLTKGCIPSKMLVYPADLIREAQTAGRIGVRLQQPEIDWAVISGRMWEQIDFHRQIEANLMQMPGLHVYRGSARFTDPHTLALRSGGGEEDVIGADRFVVAAGARSFVPDVPGLEDTGYLTSERFFGDGFPEKPWGRLAILGGGAIGMEFAHIFSAFGTQVTVIARGGRILGKEEEEISAFVAGQLARGGVDIRTDSAVVAVGREGDAKRLTVENRRDHTTATVLCDEILVASGVRSNADTLSPEKAGIALDRRGWIETNLYLETSRSHIWALGDINGKYQFRHKANYEAQILAHNLFGGGEKRAAVYSAVPWTVFTHPQVAHVGRTERELQEAGIPHRCAKNTYSEIVAGRAMGFRTGDSDNGFVKMIVGEEKRILGVHIVGPQAAVLLQPFVYLMQMGYRCGDRLQHRETGPEIDGLRLLCPHLNSYAPILDAMVVHPSLSELTAWVFEKLE